MTSLQLFAAIIVLATLANAHKGTFFKRISEQKCYQYSKLIKNITETSNESTNNEYPYLGMLGYKEENKEDYLFMCTATLISPKFALTVGRCVILEEVESRPKLAGPLIVRFGNRDIKADVPRVDAKVLRTIKSSEFMPPHHYDPDLGLVELVEPVPLSKSIQPACVWSSPSLQGTKYGISPGWITINSTEDDISDVVRQRRLEFVGPCTRKNREKYLCTNETTADVPSCKGTIGNPLIIPGQLEDERQMAVVVAVNSILDDCSGGAGRMFAKVADYIDWIEENVWPSIRLLQV